MLQPVPQFFKVSWCVQNRLNSFRPARMHSDTFGRICESLNVFTNFGCVGIYESFVNVFNIDLTKNCRNIMILKFTASYD